MPNAMATIELSEPRSAGPGELPNQVVEKTSQPPASTGSAPTTWWPGAELGSHASRAAGPRRAAAGANSAAGPPSGTGEVRYQCSSIPGRESA